MTARQPSPSAAATDMLPRTGSGQVSAPAELPKPGTARDWSDRIHPCVILATRRTIRSYTFVLAFVALQISLFGSVVTQFVMPSFLGDGIWTPTFMASREQLFWVCVLPVFLMGLPASALWTLSYDMRSGNTETMLMTRMSPFGIVCGACLAKAVEAALMACTLLPFAVLRYWMHGTNPVLDGLYLAGLVVISSCFSAIAVGFSAMRSGSVRIVAATCVAGSAAWLPLGVLMYELLRHGVGGTAIYRYPVCSSPSNLTILPAAYLLGALIAMGCAAMTLGPPAYNCSAVARISALSMTLMWWVAVWFGMDRGDMLMLQMATGLPMLTPIMLEDAMHAQGPRPAMRAAAESETILQKLWLPGWQAGAWWVLATVILWAMPLATVWGGRNLLVFPATLGAVFFPFVVIRCLALFLRIRQKNVPEAWKILDVTPTSGVVYVLAILCASYIFFQLITELFAAAAAEVFFMNPVIQLASFWDSNGRGYATDVFRDDTLLACLSAWPAFAILALASLEYHVKVRSLQTKGVLSIPKWIPPCIANKMKYLR